MNIISTEYSLKTKSLDVYVAGCRGRCRGCHNPETWNFDQGQPYKIEEIKIFNYIKQNPKLINRIFILGGDPLDQNILELKDFLSSLSNARREIWLFTRYQISHIDDDIKKICAYIKCGKYIEKYSNEGYFSHGIFLASKNQKIYKCE